MNERLEPPHHRREHGRQLCGASLGSRAGAQSWGSNSNSATCASPGLPARPLLGTLGALRR